jgi:hypothetical protein
LKNVLDNLLGIPGVPSFVFDDDDEQNQLDEAPYDSPALVGRFSIAKCSILSVRMKSARTTLYALAWKACEIHITLHFEMSPPGCRSFHSCPGRLVDVFWFGCYIGSTGVSRYPQVLKRSGEARAPLGRSIWQLRSRAIKSISYLATKRKFEIRYRILKCCATTMLLTVRICLACNSTLAALDVTSL